MEEGAVCIANIGRRGQRQRLVFGLVCLAAGFGLAVLLIAAGYARAWRIALLPVWLAGGIGVFQAREKT